MRIGNQLHGNVAEGSMHLIVLLAGLVVALLPATCFARGGEEGWVLIKSDGVSLAAGTQTIELPAEQARAYGVRLAVTKGRLELRRLIIHYGNGQQYFHEQPIKLSEGQRSDPIGERDESLVMEAISLAYSVEGSLPATTVQIWGRESPVKQKTGQAPRVGRQRSMGDDTRKLKGYRELEVFFGTTRRQEGNRLKNNRQLSVFSGEEGKSVTLGRAVVTIPYEREIGSIPRPEFNLVFAKFALRSEDPKKDFTLAAVDVLSRATYVERLRKMAKE